MSPRAWFSASVGSLICWVLIFTVVAHASCSTKACHRRVHAKRAAHWVAVHRPWVHEWRHLSEGWRAWAVSTARCESGLRWHIATGNGFYGGLQFTPRTWFAAQALVPRRMRTTRLPHEVDWRDQAVVGVRYAQSYGTSAWPVCG